MSGIANGQRGTKLYWRPGAIRQAEIATGQAGTHQYPRGTGEPPDLAGAGAPCTRPDADEDLWHPNGYGPAEQRQAEAAVALCNTCPVSAECLEWAWAIKATHGVWGGVWLDLPTERRRRGRKTA